MCLSPCRYALNEMDKFSLKDSGRGDSEAGDSDYEPGRESPMDRLLGEGFTEIYAPDGQHRTHAGTPLGPPSTTPPQSSLYIPYHSSPVCLASSPESRVQFRHQFLQCISSLKSIEIHRFHGKNCVVINIAVQSKTTYV